MCFIAFIDRENIEIDTKIAVIGAYKADNVISGGHFEFYIFGGNHWSDVVVPAIFEISTLKNPLGQIFMLLSRCAHIKQKMSHIRPTNR